MHCPELFLFSYIYVQTHINRQFCRPGTKAKSYHHVSSVYMMFKNKYFSQFLAMNYITFVSICLQSVAGCVCIPYLIHTLFIPQPYPWHTGFILVPYRKVYMRSFSCRFDHNKLGIYLRCNFASLPLQHCHSHNSAICKIRPPPSINKKYVIGY